MRLHGRAALLAIAGLLLASMLAEVPPARAQEACFTETGFCVAGRFLASWRERGGLAINGLPLSDEFEQVLEDGRPYRVQYFERVRLEYHPENAPPYDVLLGQFGRYLHPADPPAAREAGGIYFPETGHNLRGGFRAHWTFNGGLAQFGYPLSEVIRERLEDGREYDVQYFERARFEHHPENQPPYDVLLGQFGRLILAGALKPPDSQYPAAGICATRQGAVATVTINGDTPAPRCQVVRPGQHLQVANSTSHPVRVRLAQIDATIPPQGEQTIARPFGIYLTPDVHLLAISASASGAELWLQE